MDFGKLSGQSAIEYLMTYGWMLLVVAVAGGAVFSMAESNEVETTSGFSSSDVRISNFGATDDETLQLEVADGSGQGIVISKVNVSDPNTDHSVSKEFVSDNRVNVENSQIFEIPLVNRSDSSSELDVKITYNSSGLTNLEETGKITGNLEITDTNYITGGSGGTNGGEGGEDTGPAYFEIFGVNDNEVDEGELVELDFNVENTGGEQDSKSVVLNVEDQNNPVNSTNVQLDSSESTSQNLNWSTDGLDAGVYDYNISSEDDYESGEVTVNEQTQFYTDFSEYEDIDDITEYDWSNHWEVDGVNFAVEEGTISWSDWATDRPVGVSWDEVPDDVSDAEVFATIEDYDSEEQAAYVYTNAEEAEGGEMGVAYGGGYNQGEYTDEARISYDGSAEAWEVIDINAPYHIRFRAEEVNGENNLKLKIWEVGDNEPDWQLELENDELGSGNIVIGDEFYETSGFTVSEFSVGIEGENAPTEPVN